MGDGRRNVKNDKPVWIDTGDPDGIAALARRHLDWMEERNYSPHTIRTKESHLRFFALWCAERSLFRPDHVTKTILERYQRHLFLHRREDGRALSFRTQRARLVTVQVFFRWLCRKNYLQWNPASELELPKVERTLPRGVLSISEVERILNEANIKDLYGLRDRAIMETLYSTGMRRTELVNLSVYDLDAENGTVFVRQGKGKKDRVVPIGARALKWIDKYFHEARPRFITNPKETALFLNNQGQSLTSGGLTNLVKIYLQQAEITKPGACHLFRHTMATLMLENGADIRFIQQILGHAKLETTQIYTHVSISQLKEVHAATHPARLSRSSRSVNEEANQLLFPLAAEDNDA